MNIPRFKLGTFYNRFFCKNVPAIVEDENGEYVKLRELERVQEELEKAYGAIEDKELLIVELHKAEATAYDRGREDERESI